MTPEFWPDDGIIVDTEQREAQSGDYVVVKDDAAEEATFKQFMKTGEGLRLRPINLTKHREIVFAPEHRLVGKVVRLIRSY